MGPRSIPKRHGKHQNFKAADWRLTLSVFMPLVVAFVFLPQKFGKVARTYNWYFVSLWAQFEKLRH